MIFPYNTDAPIYHYPIATISLIVTNALLFLIVPARFLQVPLPEELLLEGETNPTFTMLLEYGNGLHPLQWLASPFMHADILHLASNMLVLWSFGLVVEGKVGSVVFVALYMLIAVGQSALEQAMMLFASGGASLGASAAIFGILGIAVVWAPSNNFDVVWFLGFRGGSFEMPILLYGFLSLVLEVFTLVYSNFSVSGSLLHLMGLGFGLGLGFLWLRRDWVDCEGWDLITVLRGREGQTHHEQQAALDAEANELLRSTRKNLATSSRQEPSKDAGPTRSKGKKERKRGGRSDSMPKTTAQPSAQSQTSEQAVAELVATGNLAVALKLIAKLRQDGTCELSESTVFLLIRGLLGQNQYTAAVPFLREHIERFSHRRTALQLNLAKVLVHLERPRKALEVLKQLDTATLDDDARKSAEKLIGYAKLQIEQGTIELSE